MAQLLLIDGGEGMEEEGLGEALIVCISCKYLMIIIMNRAVDNFIFLKFRV